MTRIHIIGLMLAALLLGACETGTGERAASGTGLGVAAGPGVAGLSEAEAQGAGLVGAAAGAAAGALPEPSTVNRGGPGWQ